MLKVCKFGGSSVANADQIRKVADIVKSDPARKVIVVSAPSGVTKLLDEAWEYRKDRAIFVEKFEELRKVFSTNILNLGFVTKSSLKHILIDSLGKLLHEITSNRVTKDYVVSRGEYLNAMTIADYLGYKFVDAQNVIFFNSNGSIAWNTTEDMTVQSLVPHIGNGEGVVVPGFYGSMPDYAVYGVKTFSRGGSDVTGAILAKVLRVDLYENWTDVEGLHTADPRIVPGAKHVREVTYTEMRELAYSGAVVLHADAIPPVREAGIPINIRNTNAPDDEGTMVVAEKKSNEPVTGIAARCGFMGITVKKVGMNDERGFIKKITDIFEEKGISLEHTPTGIDRLSVIVRALDRDEVTEIIERICTVCGFDKKDWRKNIEIHSSLALITVVGENMNHMTGIAGRIFSAVGKADINVRMVTQDLGEMNVIFAIMERDSNEAVGAVYDEFFGDKLKYSWMVIRPREGIEDETYPFNDKNDAKDFFDEISVGWPNAYLCKVENGPLA